MAGPAAVDIELDVSPAAGQNTAEYRGMDRPRGVMTMEKLLAPRRAAQSPSSDEEDAPAYLPTPLPLVPAPAAAQTGADRTRIEPSGSSVCGFCGGGSASSEETSDSVAGKSLAGGLPGTLISRPPTSLALLSDAAADKRTRNRRRPKGGARKALPMGRWSSTLGEGHRGFHRVL